MKKIIALVLTLITSSVLAWPTRDITLIVPYPPGGVNDQLARFMQPDLESILRVPVIVKNMPGAANLLAINHVLNQSNDNHTFIISMDDFLLGPLYQNQKTYKDFVSTNIIGTVPYMFYGGANTSLTKFKEQIKNRATVNVGNNGVNGSAHLWTTGLISSLTINPIFYKGAAPTIADVVAGHSEYGVTSITATNKWIQSGRLNPIMQSSNTRNHLYPNVPTAQELGFKGPTAETWFAVFARKDTDTQALTIFGDRVRLIIANNVKIQAMRDDGMNLINLSGSSADAFYRDQITKFEKTKNK
jgi:tripartite-type tricarboxylate transporter receptor subunit TctC